MYRVLITGITGSLGSRLAKHYLELGWEVRGLSRCEDKQATMKRKFPEIEFMLGDVRDYETCFRACEGMNLVIHTAALKRIEKGEESPEEFIRTNIIGTMNMVKATESNSDGSKFVFISTDKAVEPINVYGMTKAIAEKIVTGAGFNCVRYGNVNNSRGSVIPYWKDLMENDKPLPITNPDMTRFMISYERAIDLIRNASGIMDGRIYVPKLKSTSIRKLADAFGCETEIVGERSGEKVHEVLINENDFRNHVEEYDNHFIIVKKNVQPRNHERYSSDKAEQMSLEELKEVIWKE